MRIQKYLTVLLAVTALAACDVDVKDKGELPDVDVKEGRAPDVDVTGPDVDVNREQKTITVPDVDVKVPKENEQ